jgi:hypothetical protein
MTLMISTNIVEYEIEIDLIFVHITFGADKL